MQQYTLTAHIKLQELTQKFEVNFSEFSFMTFDTIFFDIMIGLHVFELNSTEPKI